MNTIERILGVQPLLSEVINEFNKRKLTINRTETVVEHNKQFHVHGHVSTKSYSRDEALMKYAIILDEVA